MPLNRVKCGESLIISHIAGKPDVKRHLENLGFVVGEMITVVSEMAGNIIVNVKGSRVALNRAMASRIMIS